MKPTKETRTISRDTYLKCLGLFTFANSHYVKCREAQLLMDEILGEENGGHVNDALYDDNLASAASFDEALKRSGIVVDGDPQ